MLNAIETTELAPIMSCKTDIKTKNTFHLQPQFILCKYLHFMMSKDIRIKARDYCTLSLEEWRGGHNNKTQERRQQLCTEVNWEIGSFELRE